ncbi:MULTISPECIES: carbohydrate ABC transporter permease [Kribbella]|jgi:multiple sugar transport system permease protein|uniref:Carbohydrate ABC transporter membrane protein 2 (CUT1 family) n=1 Tax=Kribbella pratensis TaxID=2512112 RepID=A0ABY2F9A4_9ACTN|nr:MULTISPECIES: carbohydrate ABC transporter permease [Kribbella]TDW87151.1 carbohydrate ABC transporter membrane protein 2 (CUT1 family) [Kribbella pratensis]TDW91527.1 carbohydrate ABC transporter membrane protein 2 (CUT1 family) [Kribbella sp. VKM Ac-2566]
MTSETNSAARKVRSGVSHTLLVIVAIVFLGPLVYAVSTSLKPADEVFTPTPHLFGSEIRWKNYADAFTFAPFDRYFLNSLLVAVAGTFVVVAASSLSAYAFARLKFRGREQLFVLFLGTLMVPQEVLIVPMYWLMQALGWVDSYWALILPWAFTAFGTFLLRQFFLTVPAELEEAARVDGCGPFGSFFRIMLPLARPAIAVLTVFTFISFWGSFLWPLIIINSVEDKGTVPLGLAQFVGQQGTQWNLMMAASVMAMIPTVLLVVLLQKHLVRGLLVTGLGGR